MDKQFWHNFQQIIQSRYGYKIPQRILTKHYGHIALSQLAQYKGV